MFIRLLSVVLVFALAHIVTALEPSLAELTSANVGPAGSIGVEMSQLFLRTNNQDRNARVYFGRGENSFSMGLNSQGSFSVASTQGTSKVTPPGNSKADKDILVVAHDHVAASNLIARSASVKVLSINNVVQWQSLQDFTFSKPSNEWSKNPIMKCAGLDILSLDETHKVIKAELKKLPKHSQIRVVATAHFVDDWQGETAYLKINDNYVWTESHELRNGAKGLNICGSDRYMETKFSVPIDVTLPSVGESMNLEFGSSMETGTNAHFGISSVSLYIHA